MSANFSGVPALLGNMQYSAGEITGVNAGVQYRDAMRMKNLEAALNIAAQQQAQANLDRQRQDQLRQYRDQQARMSRQDQRQAMLDQYGMRQDALANQWKERMFAESQGDKAYARQRDTVMDERYRRGLDMELDKQMYGAMRDKIADQRYATERERLEEQQNYERGRDTIKDQQWQAEMDRQNARVALEDKRYATQEQHWKAEENRRNTEMQWRKEDRDTDNSRQWWKMMLDNPLTQAWAKQGEKKPLSISDAKAVQELQKEAMAGDTTARNALLSMGITPMIPEYKPVESQERSWLGIVDDWFGRMTPFTNREQHQAQYKTGYTLEGIDAELKAIQQQAIPYQDAIRNKVALTPQQQLEFDEIMKRIRDLKEKRMWFPTTNQL